MISGIISRIVILIFGTLYPAYASYKAVKTKNVKEYVKWMMYWIVFAFFTTVETFADIFVSWIPFYYELKILFVLWLLSPATKGASILYRKFIHPQLAKRETEIDKYISKASDQGYTALLSLGSKGINYATNIVLTTAIKGQSKIADHLKKSYSLNDLTDGDNRQVYVHDSDDDRLSDEDETDNRLIEESYEREMRSRRELREPEEEKEKDTEEAKPRKRRPHSTREPEGHYEGSVDDVDLERSTRSTRSKKGYSHKEAYHYGTLPRSSRSRSSRSKRAALIQYEDEEDD